MKKKNEIFHEMKVNEIIMGATVLIISF